MPDREWKHKRLYVPEKWKDYWSAYPQGYTILEALIDWVHQVNNMADNLNDFYGRLKHFRNEIDNFKKRFDDNLQEEVERTLSDWQDSGFLEIIIDQALETKYHEMDERLTTQLEYEASKTGLSSTAYDSLQDAIDDAAEKGEQLVISGYHLLDGERLLIDKPITIVFSNNAFFIQTEFAYPIFEVRSKDVKFYGKLRAENIGTPFHITSAEVINRGLTVPTEVANDPKGYSAVVACIGNVDNLYIEHVEGKNFVTTVSFLSSVSSSENYSDKVKVDYAYGEKQWTTVLGGGFKFAELGTIVGKNMVWSQGSNPNHVLYIGTREKAYDEKIYVDKVIGYDCPDMSYIASVKTVNEFICNEVNGFNCMLALVVSYGDAKVGSVKGYFVGEGKDNIVKVDLGANATIDSVDISTSSTHNENIYGASVVGCVGGTSNLEIFNLNLNLTSNNNPMRAIRSSATLKLHNININYVSSPQIHPIECSNGSLYILKPPTVKKLTDKLINITNAKDYLIIFNPNLVDGDINDNTIVINDNNFNNLIFTDFYKKPPEEQPLARYNLRARNVLKLRGAGNTVTDLNYGSNMQEYLLIAGDDGTSPRIAHGTGNIFLKSGSDYIANSWQAIKLICVDGKFYEV